MAGRRDYIHELPAKLAFLASRMPRGTWRELEEKSKIWRSTFDQACNENDPAYSMLGRVHQERLAKACGFSISWPEWRDEARPDKDPVGRIDTVDAFKQMLIREIGRLSQPEAAEGAAAIATKRSEVSSPTEGAPKVEPSEALLSSPVRDVTAELVAGKRRPTSSPFGTMAQLALSSAQPAGPGEFQALVEVSCHKGNIVGSTRQFTVRRALLTIDCGDARGRRAALAGINGMPVVLKNFSGETRFTWRGTERWLCWEVVAGGAMIGHLLFDAGIIEELAPGDVLRVSLSAWLKHMNADEVDQDPAFGILGSDGALADLPPDKITIEQRRLIEHVNKLTLKIDGNGQAELATAELELVRKP